jgi:FtsH-binding integral membrane protein
MENYNQQQPFSQYTVIDANSNADMGAASKKFIANVFLWMFVALGISTFSAFLFATTPSLLGSLVQTVGDQTNPHTGLTTLGWAVMLAPIGFVLLMSFGYQKLSAPALTLLFILYAAITGISLSFILLVYTSGSVMGCFAAASVTFGIMAVMGYTTSKDLTSFGRLMMMGLIGIIVSVFINMFLHSSQLDYIISIVGVMVFTGLTAYDVQKLKRIGAGIEFEGVSANDAKKASVMGALTLYLDFINLFLMLLRLFGRRRN